MEKFVFMALIFSLFLTGCATTREGLKIVSNDEEWSTFNMGYNRMVADIPFTKMDVGEENDRFGVEIGLGKALDEPIRIKKYQYGKEYHQYAKEHKMDIMYIRFWNLTDKYQFDTAKVYLITSSQKYHLKAIDYDTGEPIDYSMIKGNNNNINHSKYIFYRLPLIREELEGASFEISGIYKNGVELPPIKFQISLYKYKTEDMEKMVSGYAGLLLMLLVWSTPIWIVVALL